MTEEAKKELDGRLDVWSADMRTFLGDAVYDLACAPYISPLRSTGSQTSAVSLSHAITVLNRTENYDSATRVWHNPKAKALWLRGNQIRDAYLGVSLEPKGPVSA